MRHQITFALLGLTILLSTAQSRAQPSPRRPNVLFVLIDDMGYADLSCYGNKQVHTAQVDRLATEGIRFTQFYVNCPICSPSRTSLLTGQYAARWKLTSFLASRKENHDRGMANWLDPAAPTLARAMHANGYATGHFGKWHMGGQRDVGDAPLITEYGFDQSLTTFEGLGDRILPLLDSFDGKPPVKYSLGSDKLGRGKIIWVDRSVVTTSFVDAAIGFIKKSQADGKPFYVDVWPDDVHSPFFPPKALRGHGSKHELYEGVVQATDDQLTPLFDLVRNDPKLRDNTIILVASDNGPEPGAGSPGRFRGHKGNLYEGGIREPFIVWGPGLLDPKSAGSVNERTVVAGVDVLPSVLAMTGGHLTDGQLIDGQDLGASMLGKEQAVRNKPLYWLRPPDRPGPTGDPFPDLAIRDGDWKLLVDEDGSRPQLYDLGHDDEEKHDLAGAQPAVVDRLKKMVLQWRATLPVAQLPPRGSEPRADIRDDNG
jgi:arylsulfatase A-like enzyme